MLISVEIAPNNKFYLCNDARLLEHLSSPILNSYALLSSMHSPEDFLCSQLAFLEINCFLDLSVLIFPVRNDSMISIHIFS